MPQLSHARLAVPVRAARRFEHRAIRGVLRAAYQEYAEALPPAAFDRYLQDVLDLGARAQDGRLLVAEHAGRIVGTVTFYDDAAAEGFGWPSGWAGVRALGVDPAVRGSGSAGRCCGPASSGPSPPAPASSACTPPSS